MLLVLVLATLCVAHAQEIVYKCEDGTCRPCSSDCGDKTYPDAGMCVEESSCKGAVGIPLSGPSPGPSDRYVYRCDDGTCRPCDTTAPGADCGSTTYPDSAECIKNSDCKGAVGIPLEGPEPKWVYRCDDDTCRPCDENGADCGSKTYADSAECIKNSDCKGAVGIPLSPSGSGSSGEPGPAEPKWLYRCDDDTCRPCDANGAGCGSKTYADSGECMRNSGCRGAVGIPLSPSGSGPSSTPGPAEPRYVYRCDGDTCRPCDANGADCGSETYADAEDCTQNSACTGAVGIPLSPSDN